MFDSQLSNVSPLGGGVEGVDRLAARHEQAVPVPADEAQVRGFGMFTCCGVGVIRGLVIS